MPLQNRVTPFAEIIAVPDRGMFMGNRGVLHDHKRQLVRQHTSYKAWVTCLIKFKDRKRDLITPGHYTELFFLDEATALAAGHRPCWECRRACFRQFKAAWLAGNPDASRGGKARITEIDKILHDERLTAEGKKRIYQAAIGELPDGALVRRQGGDNAFLLWRDRLHCWTPAGYDGSHQADMDEVADVLTPVSIVNAIRAGYEPELHHSVR